MSVQSEIRDILERGRGQARSAASRGRVGVGGGQAVSPGDIEGIGELVVSLSEAIVVLARAVDALREESK